MAMKTTGDVLSLFLQVQKAYLKYCYNAVKDEPIKMTEMMCILYLDENAPSDTSNEIAKRYMLSRSLVSKTVDGLKNGGYLQTERDQTDNRKIHLHLTEKCEPILEKINKAKDTFYNGISKDVTDREQEVVCDFAQKLKRNLNTLVGHRSPRTLAALHSAPDADAYFDWTMKG